MTDTILNLEEVAKMLKVSERTIQREVADGKLKAFRVGRALRFRAGAIDEYIENQEVKPGELVEDKTEDAA